MDVEAIIEIPRGSRNKYEIDHGTGEIWLDRLLFTATQYPADYGFIPHTLADDGDPLDVLVLLDEPTFPGCHIRVRPVGVFRMRDEKGEDCKVLAVPATDPRWGEVSDIDDLSAHQLDEIRHFFAVYKELEPGKGTEVVGWAGSRDAGELITTARAAAGGPEPA
ncbi:MAG TPA: inorganic diphosphatase [Acidimicrobiales bacterium]|nr:inorganic diphosphatase [Acidimicrobiales bacterium]